MGFHLTKHAQVALSSNITPSHGNSPTRHYAQTEEPNARNHRLSLGQCECPKYTFNVPQINLHKGMLVRLPDGLIPTLYTATHNSCKQHNHDFHPERSHAPRQHAHKALHLRAAGKSNGERCSYVEVDKGTYLARREVLPRAHMHNVCQYACGHGHGVLRVTTQQM